MKIGDEVYVHGYVDEMRNDVIIIRNDGGYFGTVGYEVLDKDTEEYKRGRIDALNELMEYTYGMLTAEKFGLQHEIKSMIWDAMGIADTPQTDCDHRCVQTEVGCERTDCARR